MATLRSITFAGTVLAISLSIAAPVLLPSGDADAMPGFARKYKMSCTTCHAPPPRLKPYGEEFAGRGFRLEDPSQEPARATHDVGDPLLMLNREIPLGIRLEGYASVKEDAEAESDAEFPWAWKILSGGPITPTASYYFYFLIERGEVVGLEDAYLQLNGIFGLPVDLMLGQFQICDPMFKREVRLERSDYLIYKTEVGASGLDLTYDRGVILGTELPGGIETVVQVVNGNGIHGADAERDFDDDRYKNVALRFARGIEAIGESIRETRVGVFGYYAKQDRPGDTFPHGSQNETLYLGGDLSTTFDDVCQVNLQYLRRTDDDPYFSRAPVDDFLTQGGFAELHVFPQGQNGRWVISALYNHVEIEPPAGARDVDDVVVPFMQEREASLTVNRLLARNLRVLVEGAYDLEGERTRGTVGLSAAF